jgi:hypothetical protein
LVMIPPSTCSERHPDAVGGAIGPASTTGMSDVAGIFDSRRTFRERGLSVAVSHPGGRLEPGFGDRQGVAGGWSWGRTAVGQCRKLLATALNRGAGVAVADG